MTMPEKNSAAWSKFSTFSRPSGFPFPECGQLPARMARPSLEHLVATSGISPAPRMITRMIE
jgi:hypothetical protein